MFDDVLKPLVQLLLDDHVIERGQQFYYFIHLLPPPTITLPSVTEVIKKSKFFGKKKMKLDLKYIYQCNKMLF